jgi:hypothetical protein
MSDSGKFFAGNTAAPTDLALEGDWPCTRKEVAQYVINAFATWHAPTDKLGKQTAKVIDVFFMYAKVVGFELKDGRVRFDVEDIAKWAVEQKTMMQAASDAAPVDPGPGTLSEG